MTAITDLLEQNPETWAPKVGDVVEGTIVDLTDRTSDFGTYPIVTIDTGDGLVVFHAFHTVPRNKLKEQRAQTGDKIGVKYLGKPKGKEYENYRIIIIERPPAVPNPLPAVAEEPF